MTAMCKHKTAKATKVAAHAYAMRECEIMVDRRDYRAEWFTCREGYGLI